MMVVVVLIAGLYWLSLPLLTDWFVQFYSLPLLLLLGWVSIKLFVENQQLKGYAYRDSLTGLYNRRYAEKYIAFLLKNNNYPIGLIYCDINSLKKINDCHGHQIGDQQLQLAANILRESCRREDVIVRWGGDEFLVLLPQTSLAEVKEISKRIIDNCQAAVQNCPVEVAVGYEMVYSQHCGFTQMLRNAEQAMYRHKARQKA